MNSRNFIESLQNLNADQKPLWGKMTAQHMVEHLYKTVQASINEITLKIYSEERRIPVFKKLFFAGFNACRHFLLMLCHTMIRLQGKDRYPRFTGILV